MVMNAAALMVLVCTLGQEPAAAEPAETPPDAPAAEVIPAREAPAVRRTGPSEELTRLLQELKEASPEQKPTVMEELYKKYGAASSSPMVPSPDIDITRYRELPEADQVRVIARDFLNDVLNGNASGAASRCGTPFMMEDRRIEHLEDVRTEWSKNLRTKRTDLLSLYDLEVLTPSEMEKKYGKPPPRLSSWNWRSNGALLVVANVSGRAAVMLMKQYGVTWQVVGFHD